MTHDPIPASVNGVPFVLLRTPCVVCSKPILLTVVASEWAAYQQGGRNRSAMPSMSKDDMDMLTSGTCSKCFARLFVTDAEVAS